MGTWRKYKCIESDNVIQVRPIATWEDRKDGIQFKTQGKKVILSSSSAKELVHYLIDVIYHV